MFPIIPFLYLTVCGIPAIILWYKMLGIMSRQGKKVNYFLVTPGAFFDFAELIKEEPNPTIKKKYRVLLWTQIALIPIYLVGMIIIFVLTK